MKTETNRSELPYQEKYTGLESVKFHDGMVVSAEDLETASQYPVSLLQSVLRSYLGCGVVCGLELNPITKPKSEWPWVVRVGRGLVVDCHGFPVELTCPVDLDFTPDPCAPDKPGHAYIALRRTTSDEIAGTPCSCSSDRADETCSRVRDRALVQAFTWEQLKCLPGGVCRRPEKPTEDPQDCGDGRDDSGATGGTDGVQAAAVPDWCTTLKECSCSCTSDWVLLGSVEFQYGEEGKKDDRPKGIVKIDADGRRWVKPVGGVCDVGGLVQRVSKLEETVAQLNKPRAQ